MNNWTNETTDALASIIGEATDIAPAEKQAEQDAVCGWSNPPPPEHDYPQAYANQASTLGIGMQRHAGFDQGYQAAMGERNYQDEQRRSHALALALQFNANSEADADAVVKTAEAFLAFLKGETA